MYSGGMLFIICSGSFSMFQMFTYQNVLQRLYELIYSDDLYG